MGKVGILVCGGLEVFLAFECVQAHCAVGELVPEALGPVD